MSLSQIQRLEQYTLRNPQEVLLVTAEVDGEEDYLTIYKGFSSSLMRPTAFDPDTPILSATAKILLVDRVASPYNPEAVVYLERGLNWQRMEQLLVQIGL